MEILPLLETLKATCLASALFTLVKALREIIIIHISIDYVIQKMINFDSI